jgi:cell division protease FtsH
VTILPTGMALGVTQQLPIEERYTLSKEYLEDRLCVSMGGRCAEQIVLGALSTGASNDLQKATEIARKMVREFGMSERIGPMAWGQEAAVFLGEDLMHSRDYSDVTSRVVDEEVERILREQEVRATRLLGEHRRGLNAVAAALREKETIDGAEVGRLVDEAYGRPVHEDQRVVPKFATPEPNGRPDPEATPAQAPVAGAGIPSTNWQRRQGR